MCPGLCASRKWHRTRSTAPSAPLLNRRNAPQNQEQWARLRHRPPRRTRLPSVLPPSERQPCEGNENRIQSAGPRRPGPHHSVIVIPSSLRRIRYHGRRDHPLGSPRPGQLVDQTPHPVQPARHLRRVPSRLFRLRLDGLEAPHLVFEPHHHIPSAPNQAVRPQTRRCRADARPRRDLRRVEEQGARRVHRNRADHVGRPRTTSRAPYPRARGGAPSPRHRRPEVDRCRAGAGSRTHGCCRENGEHGFGSDSRRTRDGDLDNLHGREHRSSHRARDSGQAARFARLARELRYGDGSRLGLLGLYRF